MAALPTDPTLIPSAVANILGLQGTVAEDQSAATGQNIVAAGTSQEASAYGSAGQIALSNEELARVSGDVQQFQAAQQQAAGIGTQRADIANSGFQESGSSLAGLTASYRRGALNQQIIGTQTAINEGGYAQQAITSQGEQTAANTAAQSAAALAAAYTTAGTTAQTNATNETAALMGYINATQPPGTPVSAQNMFAETLLQGTPGSPVALPQGTWYNSNGTWLYGNPATSSGGLGDRRMTGNTLGGGLGDQARTSALTGRPIGQGGNALGSINLAAG